MYVSPVTSRVHVTAARSSQLAAPSSQLSDLTLLEVQYSVKLHVLSIDLLSQSTRSHRSPRIWQLGPMTHGWHGGMAFLEGLVRTRQAEHGRRAICPFDLLL